MTRKGRADLRSIALALAAMAAVGAAAFAVGAPGDGRPAVLTLR